MGTVIVLTILVAGFIYLNIKDGWMYPWAVSIYCLMLAIVAVESLLNWIF